MDFNAEVVAPNSVLAIMAHSSFPQRLRTMSKFKVVGIGDSGLDYNSCFFSDSRVPVTFPSAATGSVFESATHRKLAAYRAMVDTSDGAGHGTHVSGCLAGRFSRGLSCVV